MAVNSVVFSKDKGRLLCKKLEAALVSKFGEDKVKNVRINKNGEIRIVADLTAAQWNGVKTRLEEKGYFPDMDFDFN